jgi:GH3 auxin-responsive promoter
MIRWAANALWLAGCLPEAGRFRRATARVRAEQQAVLQRVLRANATTEFGDLHAFASIADPREYQDRVPVRTFEDHQPWIARAAEGAQRLLTTEPVRLFEPTSGSTGASKLIPYTSSLRREFQRGIRTWVADLFTRRPELMSGPAYWSISPVGAANRRTPGGIPIGFEDDAAYLGGWQRRLAQVVMAVPPDIRNIRDIRAFRYRTLLALVRCPDLRLVSVWNPTFLSLLVEQLPERGEALARDLTGDRRSTERLRAALRARTPEERHATLWPRLAVISCWSDGNAAAAAAEMAALFPHARIQGKGLIATEAFVSLPLDGRPGAALAVRSHFFEFAAVNAEGETLDDRPRLAHELDVGRRYAVIVTTGGGLYRYRLGDVVEVVGQVNECPVIRFIGRQGNIADWFGEKLNEAHVACVLREAFDAVRLSPRFAMLACETTPSPARYVLYIDAVEADEVVSAAALRVDTELRRSFHYDYARALGQLAPLGVFRATRANDAYLARAMRAGQRAGDVKLLALDRGTGWSQEFEGRFIG